MGFGYPRSDTYSKCDETDVALKTLESKEAKAQEQKAKLLTEIKKLETEKKVHLSRANAFYDRKRASNRSARLHDNVEAICMDYSKNLPIPNISTNDIYYSRQLSLYLFNVHVLSNQQSIFYSYINVKRLKIFCDSCGGQNKNYTVFRFLHHIIHYEKKLEHVKVTFPIRGHSYMESDKDFGLVNQKTRTETPSDWKPTPFVVEDVQQNYLRSWTKHLQLLYLKKCPFPIRPLREIEFSAEHPRLAFYRNSYFGEWESADIGGKPFKQPNNTG
ncbi:unnamed protein product [Psylliodes chrysocephalus]|uniref:DUF7869 domain-containing protein n=1 Tax=Psylliodes chrysocephalus TaxID=3402493 RepID=A0A9P0CBR8_9CUCU|nr:unnamed protein product [Psylliodes chrysocephala]